MDKIKELVRIANTDIRGHKGVIIGLTKIYGVSYSFSNAICVINNIEKTKKIGALGDDEIKNIEATILNPEKLPSWMRNRRKEIDSGDDEHAIGPQLKLKREFDLRRLKKIKSYRGMRHAGGLPVRGQKTKGHFRKGKAVGVVKRAQKQQKTGKPKASSGKSAGKSASGKKK